MRISYHDENDDIVNFQCLKLIDSDTERIFDSGSTNRYEMSDHIIYKSLLAEYHSVISFTMKCSFLSLDTASYDITDGS